VLSELLYTELLGVGTGLALQYFEDSSEVTYGEILFKFFAEQSETKQHLETGLLPSTKQATSPFERTVIGPMFCLRKQLLFEPSKINTVGSISYYFW